MSRALALAVAGAALALAGLAFDVLALRVPGLAMAGLGLGGAAWVAAAVRGASVVRDLPSDRVVEEERWPLRLALRPGLVPPPRAELVDPLLAGRAPRLSGRRPRARVEVRFARRGRRRLEPARIVISDPLRLAVREISSDHGEVLVLPRVEPVLVAGSEGSGARPAPSGSRRLEAAAAELELDSLRPYRPGTPAARIHWPTVARTGEVVERRLTAGADDRPLVVLDASRPRSSDGLDRAVRAAASLALHLGRRSGCGLLLPGEHRPLELGADLAAWPALHARLAAVEESPRGPALDRAGRRGAVYWVTAGRSGVPRALGGGPGGGCYLVAPSEGADEGAAFTVAGCSGRAVSPRSVRAA